MEIAIEEGEQTATKWLEGQTGENGSGRADTFGLPLLGDTDTPTEKPETEKTLDSGSRLE